MPNLPQSLLLLRSRGFWSISRSPFFGNNLQNSAKYVNLFRHAFPRLRSGQACVIRIAARNKSDIEEVKEKSGFELITIGNKKIDSNCHWHGNLAKSAAKENECDTQCEIRNTIVLAEWRNGRRWGLKIPCPNRACGFESHLGYCSHLVKREVYLES